MRSSLIQRIFLSLCAVCLLAFVAFQVYRFLESRYETETVYSTVVEESVEMTGIVLRDEVLLEERVGSGVATYLVSDGVKVSKGMPIAEIYQNTQDAEAVYKIRTLSNERRQLEKAQESGNSSYAHTDAINKQIFRELGSVIDQMNSSDLSMLPESSDKLLLLMNTKQIATGQQENFDDSIRQLKAQEEYYAERLGDDAHRIAAEQAGYFIRGIDGLENVIPFEELEELTPDRLSQALLESTSPDSTLAGKLMVGHVWNFAAMIDVEQLEPFRVGRNVTLNFGVSGMNPVPAIIRNINEDKDTGKAVVIFESDYIDDKVVNLRITQADVAFKSISGLRVSKDALRFEELQQGVYIIHGDKVLFRPVNVIYEGNGFVLCENKAFAEANLDNNLQQFDEVIVKGGLLYDGKTVRSGG